MLNDQELKEALAALPGDRVKKEYIESRISDVKYTQVADTVLMCSLTIDNGYSVRGEAACVDPENFDRTIGERVAYDSAFARLWPLFGFLLAEQRRFQAKA